MGLFGPSKTEVEAANNTAEEALDEAKKAQQRVRSLGKELEREKEHRRNLQEAVGALSEVVVNITDSENLHPIPNREGEVVTLERDREAWKKTENAIVRLKIPAGARVVYPKGSHKLRTDEAEVLGMYDIPTNRFPAEENLTTRLKLKDQSRYDSDFEYTVGDTVTPERELNTNIGIRCRSGIHIFRSFSQAARW
jgi:hypothetical protein